MSDQPLKIPRHVAIIMDGNGRWAKRRMMPRIAGHRVGAKAVRRAIQYCVKHHIEVLTLFALSVENLLNRPRAEVRFLLSLFSNVLTDEIDELNKANIRVRIVGDYHVFDDKLCQKIEYAQSVTNNNTGLVLVIAVNYSGRADIFQAAKCMAAKMVAQGKNVDELQERDFSRHILLSDLPEPDLLIRTSGEQRISNFLLWQLAYTELCFIEECWPDFDEHIFTRAIEIYQKRERRFGDIIGKEKLEMTDAEN